MREIVHIQGGQCGNQVRAASDEELHRFLTCRGVNDFPGHMALTFLLLSLLC